MKFASLENHGADATFSAETRASRMPAIRWRDYAGRGLLLVWASFWLWFSASVVISEGALPWPAAAFMGAVIMLTAAAWIWPRAGGLLLLGGAIFAGGFFVNFWAEVLLALPAALIALLRVWSATPGQRAVGRVHVGSSRSDERQ